LVKQVALAAAAVLATHLVALKLVGRGIKVDIHQ
jgi:hypothetical protein